MSYWHCVKPRAEGCVCSPINRAKRIYDWEDTKAYVICLASRPDRLEYITNEIHRIQLCGQTQFYRPVKPTKEVYEGHGFHCATNYGCWHSHRTVVEEGHHASDLEGKNGPVLVLEDDAYFQPHFTPEKLQEVMTILRYEVRPLEERLERTRRLKTKQWSWDILYLGHLPVFGAPLAGRLHDTDYREVRSVLAHAYFISKEARAKLLAKPIEPEHTFPYILAGQGIDSWYCRTMKALGPVPSYVTQYPIASDHHANKNIATGIVPWILKLHHQNPALIEKIAIGLWPILILCLLKIILFVWFVICVIRKRRSRRR